MVNIIHYLSSNFFFYDQQSKHNLATNSYITEYTRRVHFLVSYIIKYHKKFYNSHLFELVDFHNSHSQLIA